MREHQSKIRIAIIRLLNPEKAQLKSYSLPMKPTIKVLVFLCIASLALSSCREAGPFKVEKGVSKKLNDHRHQTISNIAYKVFFKIPSGKEQSISGNETLTFNLSENNKPLVIDFNEAPEKILSVKTGEKTVKYKFENGHLTIPDKYLGKGQNKLNIEFVAGDLSLNRNDDFLYTLFVPDRASTAFPCFDQPNLKAMYTLTLDVPPDWVAVANGPLKNIEKKDGRQVYHFSETKPIPTYLFAFVSGKFQKVARERNGRQVILYHRETDAKKVKKNLDEIFKLEFDALDWMENYTGIKYPFGKFSMVAIPSFQYSGMEHPGAVLYRAEKLFLDPSATQDQILGRASLMAHETAHMWFGDLVTMDWFDDVWLKEVFANFMAAKIVNPAFPRIDHQQAFIIDHYPKAYAIDRTAGANAIKQKLNNLNMAGTLYGAIIYHKAPIVMLQLENLLGKANLQKGLQEYLHTYSYANADWDDLIGILDAKTDKDLKKWSVVWVKEPGMPQYNDKLTNDSLLIRQVDPAGKGRIWPQMMNVTLVNEDSTRIYPVFVEVNQYTVPVSSQIPELTLLNGKGRAYGYFRLNDDDIKFLVSSDIFTLKAGKRTIAYISVWENFLRGRIDPVNMASALILYIQNENNEQNINLLLTYYKTFFWRYTEDVHYEVLAEQMEKILFEKITTTPRQSLKSAYYKTFVKTAYSKQAVRLLYALWKGDKKIQGLDLSEDDMTTLAYELAVRRNGTNNTFIPDTILQMQLAGITNPDRRKKMAFIMPALSQDKATRDAFFESLKNPANREHEPWVLTALTYLHHPLRAGYSRKYILPSLNMLKEIQATGDIFFPKGWLDATFSGHKSIQAANYVTLFLNNHPKLDPKLKQKVLQSADPVRRAVLLAKNNNLMN